MGDTKEICKGCKKEKEPSAFKSCEKCRAKNMEYHNKNKEKNNERRMNHYWNNREQAREYARKYKQEHREEINAKARERRAKKNEEDLMDCLTGEMDTLEKCVCCNCRKPKSCFEYGCMSCDKCIDYKRAYNKKKAEEIALLYPKTYCEACKEYIRNVNWERHLSGKFHNNNQQKFLNR